MAVVVILVMERDDGAMYVCCLSLLDQQGQAAKRLSVVTVMVVIADGKRG